MYYLIDSALTYAEVLLAFIAYKVGVFFKKKIGEKRGAADTSLHLPSPPRFCLSQETPAASPIVIHRDTLVTPEMLKCD